MKTLAAAGAALLTLVLAVHAAASSFELSVDPRFELLGVVQVLAGAARIGEDTADYRKKIESRFGPFRDHPVVALYRDFAASASREEACAVTLLYYSAPPALALLDKNAELHHLGGRGEREEMQRFLWELRDFARVTRFAPFYAENAGRYREATDAARSALGALDPPAAIEAYLGVGLSSRARYILPMLARGTHAFIVPYPLPPASLGAKSFEVFTVSAGRPRDFNDPWHELLYVFIDPSFYYFEARNVRDPAAFYGPDIARCRSVSPECTKTYVVTALVERLKLHAGRPAGASGLDARYMTALSARLDEYERERVRYPTLWTFYPRLFSVFHELAHRGKKAKTSVPSAPVVRNVADFFDPAIVSELSR